MKIFKVAQSYSHDPKLAQLTVPNSAVAKHYESVSFLRYSEIKITYHIK